MSVEIDLTGWRLAMETKSELKVVYVALAILACQVIGIDVSLLSSLLSNPDIISTIQAANKDGGSGLGAAGLAGIYALCRAYIKGRRQ